MRMKRRIIILLLALLMIPAAIPTAALASDGPYAVAVNVSGSVQKVRAYDGSYEGNTYLSLTDLACAFSGSEKQFRFERVVSSTDGEYFNINRGVPSSLPSGGDSAGAFQGTVGMGVFRNRLFIDGAEKRYYTWKDGTGDLYMSLADIQLMLDVTAEGNARDVLYFLTDRPFLPDLNQLSGAGYFDCINAIFLADASDGAVLFRHNSLSAVPVASLSKLLSYLVLHEAMDAGEISMNDTVVISENAQRLSRSGDGMIELTAGKAVPFRELLEGMLVASSNECALALAEHLCGSEQAFVDRMNRRAQEMGLNSTQMYNCNGLPSYPGGALPVKRQNRMSAEDLFRLSAYIMARYPEITEITSLKLAHLPSLNDYYTANSNPLLYNMRGITGLKTGSTNKAGYCIAASLPVSGYDGQIHTLILVLLGAETADLRGQAAEILLRYGAEAVSGNLP